MLQRNMSGHEILNHSFSLFFSSLCQSDYASLPAILFLFLAERVKYLIKRKTHSSTVSSHEVEEMHRPCCFFL